MLLVSNAWGMAVVHAPMKRKTDQGGGWAPIKSDVTGSLCPPQWYFKAREVEPTPTCMQTCDTHGLVDACGPIYPNPNPTF